MRSRQIPIPMGKKIDEHGLLDLAKTLLGQVIVDGRAWPCANLSLSVGGFEDGVTGNRGIGSFLVKSDEAKPSDLPSRSNTATPVQDDEHPTKKRKLSATAAISRFLCKDESTGEHDPEDEVEPEAASEETDMYAGNDTIGEAPAPAQHKDIATYFCQSCSKSIPESDREEHQDWHFAKDLQAQTTPQKPQPLIQEPANSRPPGSGSSTLKRGGSAGSRGRGGGGSGSGLKAEKGQSRLAFG